MTVVNIIINNLSIWLTIDQLRLDSKDRSKIECEQEFLCYFKFSDPTPISLGELFRDNENRPMLFSSIDDAISYATRELTNKLT